MSLKEFLCKQCSGWRQRMSWPVSQYAKEGVQFLKDVRMSLHEERGPAMCEENMRMADRESVDSVLKALERSNYSWRTAQGVAAELGVSENKVAEVLEKYSEFVRAKQRNARGRSLYTSRVRYKRETPFARRLLSVITNQPEA